MPRSTPAAVRSCVCRTWLPHKHRRRAPQRQVSGRRRHGPIKPPSGQTSLAPRWNQSRVQDSRTREAAQRQSRAWQANAAPRRSSPIAWARGGPRRTPRPAQGRHRRRGRSLGAAPPTPGLCGCPAPRAVPEERLNAPLVHAKTGQQKDHAPPHHAPAHPVRQHGRLRALGRRVQVRILTGQLIKEHDLQAPAHALDG